MVAGCEAPRPDERLDNSVFNWKFYLDANPDLPQAGLISEGQSKNHWLNHGIAEGRRAAPGFFSRDYLARYADVRQIYGPNNYLDAIKHYVNKGKAAGRVGVTTCPASFLLQNGSCYETTLKGWMVSTYQGFGKYVFSFPLPPSGLNISGLSGNVSINTDGSNPSEALFIVGYVPNGNCPAQGSSYNDWPPLINALPGWQILGSFITKNLGGEPQIASTNIDFGTPVKATGCMFVVLDGGPSLGYPAPINSIFMKANVGLKLSAQSPAVQPFVVGGGDEFCFGMTSGCQKSTTAQGVDFATVNKIPMPGRLTSLYGNVSEGAISVPSGPWSATNGYYIDKGCKNLQPGQYGAGEYFNSVAPNLVLLHQFTLQGNQMTLTSTVNRPLNLPVQAGDCFVHIVRVNGNSQIDAESQVHLFIKR
jgi:hypothetical protein